MDRLDEIRARCNAATPGPWKWDVCKEYSFGDIEAERLTDVISLDDDYPGYPECGEHLIMSLSKYDANFIAHARDDIPYLLEQFNIATARAEKAEAERDTYRAALQNWHEQEGE